MVVVYFLIVAVGVVGGTTPLQVTINPPHAHLVTPEEGLVVHCAADTPLTACQVRVDDKKVVDLSRGHFSDVTGGYQYVGDGLAAGHCGVNLSTGALPAWGSRALVQCRVRAEGSDWAYQAMSVYRYSYSKLPLKTTSRVVEVPVGGEVNHVILAEEPLTRCEMEHDQLGWKNLNRHTKCEGDADTVCYQGRGLDHSECGVNVRNVTDRANGVVWFYMETIPALELSFLQIIVTKPPDSIAMTSSVKRSGDAILTLEAWCTVGASRPAANITWYLGGQVLTGGDVVFVPEERWVERHESRSTRQKLTRVLRETDHGLEMWCTANHEAMAGAISSNKMGIKESGTDGQIADPCSPAPCGTGRRCISVDREALCECVPGHFSSPRDKSCLVDCETHSDCPSNHTCHDAKCLDPCMGTCGVGTRCTVVDNVPVCSTLQQPLQEPRGMPGQADSMEPTGLDKRCCSPVVLEEHRVRLLHMEQLHNVLLQAEQARARIEKENAVAARARAKAEEENVITAKARAKNAEEELEFQRELRRLKLQELAGSTVQRRAN